MSVDTNTKKMMLEIRKRQMGLHSLTVHKDSDSGFKKEANAEVPNYPHSILRSAGTTKAGCKKTKTDWLAVQRRALSSHVRQTLENFFCPNNIINDHITGPKVYFHSFSFNF